MFIIKTLSLKAVPVIVVGALALAMLGPVATSAQTDPFGVEDAKQINVGENTDLKGSIASVVNIALGFLGILAVIIILYAGFKWMTASGNEEQVGEARKMLLQAVIGLVIVMVAWVITNFVTSQIGGVLQIE